MSLGWSSSNTSSSVSQVVIGMTAEIPVIPNTPIAAPTIEDIYPSAVTLKWDTTSIDHVEWIGPTYPALARVTSTIFSVTQNEWTFAIAAQAITENAGVTVTQGSNTGLLKTALQTEWTIAITAQAITESVGVAVTQGAVTGTLGMALQNEWTLAITSQDITENAGVTVTQGSVTGTLKTVLYGATTNVVVLTASGVTFSSSADVIIGSTTILLATVTSATNSGTTTSIVIRTASAPIAIATDANVLIGSTTVVHANINTATNSGVATNVVITAATGVTFSNSVDLVIGTGPGATVLASDIATATNSNTDTTDTTILGNSASVTGGTTMTLTGLTPLTRSTIAIKNSNVQGTSASSPSLLVSTTIPTAPFSGGTNDMTLVLSTSTPVLPGEITFTFVTPLALWDAVTNEPALRYTIYRTNPLEWTLTIAAQTITESKGVTITQGSVSGILKMELTGAGTISIVVQTATVVTFTTTANIKIGSTTVVSANLNAAANTVASVTLDAPVGTSSGSTLTASMYNFVGGQAYTYQIAAYDTCCGYGPLSAAQTFTQPAATAPSIMSISPIPISANDSHVKISMSIPSDGGSPIERYNVYSQIVSKEIQEITIGGLDGTLRTAGSAGGQYRLQSATTLTKTGTSTTCLNWDATANDVKVALDATSSNTTVRVTDTTTTSNSNSKQFLVEYLAPSGSVPLLEVVAETSMNTNECVWNYTTSHNEWILGIRGSQTITEPAGAQITQGAITGTLTNALQNEWTMAITSQGITENAGVTVTQGSVTGTLQTALINEWTMAITAQGITENVGVAVSQKEWTLTITAQDITQSAGVTVTQGSNTGILKTTLTGEGMISVVIETGTGVTFVDTADVVIGSSTVLLATVTSAANTGTTTSVVVQATSGVMFVNTADLIIGSGTVAFANVNTATNTGGTTNVLIYAGSGILFATTADLIIGGTTVAHSNVIAATNAADFTLGIASHSITENQGVAVSQNEWTMAIAPQAITQNVGVEVTQGTSVGTLKTVLLNEAGTAGSVVISAATGVSFGRTTVDVVIGGSGGSTVSAANIVTATNTASATGTLKTALVGATNTINITALAPSGWATSSPKTQCGATEDEWVVVENARTVKPIEQCRESCVQDTSCSGIVTGTLSSVADTCILCTSTSTASTSTVGNSDWATYTQLFVLGGTFVTTADLVIGSVTVLHSNITSATMNYGAATNVSVHLSPGSSLVTTTDVVIGSTTVGHVTISSTTEVVETCALASFTCQGTSVATTNANCGATVCIESEFADAAATCCEAPQSPTTCASSILTCQQTSVATTDATCAAEVCVEADFENFDARCCEAPPPPASCASSSLTCQDGSSATPDADCDAAVCVASEFANADASCCEDPPPAATCASASPTLTCPGGSVATTDATCAAADCIAAEFADEDARCCSKKLSSATTCASATEFTCGEGSVAKEDANCAAADCIESEFADMAAACCRIPGRRRLNTSVTTTPSSVASLSNDTANQISIISTREFYGKYLLLWGVRFRQLRVKPIDRSNALFKHACLVHRKTLENFYDIDYSMDTFGNKKFGWLTSTCYPEWSNVLSNYIESTSNFTTFLSKEEAKSNHNFKYIEQLNHKKISDPLTANMFQNTLYNSYPNRGWVTDFLLEDKNVLNKYDTTIKNGKFIDEQTRAVIVEFTVYLPTTGTFSSVRILFETHISGGIIFTPVVVSASFNGFSTVGNLRIITGILLTIINIYNIYGGMKDFIRSCK